MGEEGWSRNRWICCSEENSFITCEKEAEKEKRPSWWTVHDTGWRKDSCKLTTKTPNVLFHGCRQVYPNNLWIICKMQTKGASSSATTKVFKYIIITTLVCPQTNKSHYMQTASWHILVMSVWDKETKLDKDFINLKFSCSCLGLVKLFYCA